jgi:hypothetical protein
MYAGYVTSRVSKPYSRARMRGAVEVLFLINPTVLSVGRNKSHDHTRSTPQRAEVEELSRG